MKNLVDFLNKQNIEFEENVDGKRLCSFHVGGNVRLVVKPQKAEQLVALYAFLNENNIKNILMQEEKKYLKKYLIKNKF